MSSRKPATKKAAARPRSRQTTTADTTFYVVESGDDRICFDIATNAKSFDGAISELKEEMIRDQLFNEEIHVDVYEVVRRGKFTFKASVEIKVEETK